MAASKQMQANFRLGTQNSAFSWIPTGWILSPWQRETGGTCRKKHRRSLSWGEQMCGPVPGSLIGSKATNWSWFGTSTKTLCPPQESPRKHACIIKHNHTYTWLIIFSSCPSMHLPFQMSIPLTGFKQHHHHHHWHSCIHHQYQKTTSISESTPLNLYCTYTFYLYPSLLVWSTQLYLQVHQPDDHLHKQVVSVQVCLMTGLIYKKLFVNTCHT